MSPTWVCSVQGSLAVWTSAPSAERGEGHFPSPGVVTRTNSYECSAVTVTWEAWCYQVLAVMSLFLLIFKACSCGCF